MHLDTVLNEAFVNMFRENPDIKEKFFRLESSNKKDGEKLSNLVTNGHRREHILINNITFISYEGTNQFRSRHRFDIKEH